MFWNEIKTWGIRLTRAPRPCFAGIIIVSESSNFTLLYNHKPCTDQKQSSEVFMFHNPHFLFYIYDPTIINKARLSVLISGNLLLRESQKSQYIQRYDLKWWTGGTIYYTEDRRGVCAR